jgi:peptidoglycan/xylan/chitin deacetylase (PgdA/CDA1 family)
MTLLVVTPGGLVRSAGPPHAAAAAAPAGDACPRIDWLPPVVRRVDTRDPVVFVTLDDGFHRDPAILDDLTGLHPTVFIMGGVLHKEPAFWRRALVLGARFEDHTQTHMAMAGRAMDEQLGEMLAGAATQESVVGTRPTLFRPPFGSWDELTRVAAAEAGLRALVLWSIELRDGRFDVPRALRAGDIVLLHFSSSTTSDISVLRRRMRERGLHAAPLPECFV